jgi:hypothetical protein
LDFFNTSISFSSGDVNVCRLSLLSVYDDCDVTPVMAGGSTENVADVASGVLELNTPENVENETSVLYLLDIHTF